MRDEAVPAETGGELKARLEAERKGEAFVVYRDGSGEQVILSLDPARSPLVVGRNPDADLPLDFDSEASRLHAQLEAAGGEWLIVDDGLSSNGTYVNGERVVARRRLRDGDAIRFGTTPAIYRNPSEVGSEETRRTGDEIPNAGDLTDTQRRVLVALCRPFGESQEFATPATNRAIGEEVFLSVDAVKAHMRVLFERFAVGDLKQNRKRVRLAELAMRSGVVAPRDLEG
jgi:pSer/pThr/pTyr-binding forkhead associated (FHA) protein